MKPRSRNALAIVLALIAAAVAASVPHATATTMEAQTTNAAPVVGSVYFYTADPTAGSGSTCQSASRVTSFDPSAGSTRTIWVCVEATDDNGWNDICDTGATSTLEERTFSVTNSAGSSISDTTHPKTDVSMACATGSGTAVAMIGSFAMEYWRPAGSGGTAYRVTPTVTDVAGASDTPTHTTFAWTSLTALNSPTGPLDLGAALAPGGEGSDATAAIYNHGNEAFTIFVTGSALTSSTRGDAIAAGNLKFATSAAVAYASKTELTTSSQTTGVTAAVETSDTPTANTLYFQLKVPLGSAQWVPSTTYAGTLTFSTS